jgi:hypothetical protein
MVAVVVPQVAATSERKSRLVRVVVAAIVLVGVLFNAAVGLLSLIVPSAFLGLVGETTFPVTPSAAVFAEYAGARELAIAVALAACAALRITPALAAVLGVAAIANVIDAIAAVASGRWVQLPGAVVFAVAYGSAAWLTHNYGATANHSGPVEAI